MSLDLHMTPTPDGEGRFAVQLPDGWGQGRALFGGLVCGVIARAMAVTVPSDRPLRSFQATFAGPAAPGPAAVQARVLRSGRSATHCEAHLLQEGVRLAAQATFGAPRDSRLAFDAARPPALPDPEGLQDMPYLEGITPAFTRHVAFRFAHGSFPYSGAAQAELGGWVRYRDPASATGAPASLDAAWVLALLDAWPPPILTKMTAPAPASSASLHVILHPEALAGRTADAWFAFRSRSTAAHGGWADLQADLWTADGAHLASMRQLTAVFG